MQKFYQQRALRYREFARAISDDYAREAILELAREYERQDRTLDSAKQEDLANDSIRSTVPSEGER